MESSHANMVENGARCSGKNVKILNSSKLSMDRLIKVDEKMSVCNIIHVSYIRSWIETCMFVKYQHQKSLMPLDVAVKRKRLLSRKRQFS